MVWNSSRAMAIRWPRAAAMRAGSAKTSAASLAASRADRTAGKATEKRGLAPAA